MKNNLFIEIITYITESFTKALTKVWGVIAIIVTAGSTIIGATQLGFDTNQIIYVALITILSVSLLFNIAFSISQSLRIKRIVFISPSSGYKPFYSELLESLIRHVCSMHNRKFNLIPHLPAESFEPINNWALFDDIYTGKYPADGVILIPDDPDSNFDKITDFYKNKKIPLVLLDVNFDLTQYDKRSRKLLPPFIGGNEKVGGKIAAEIMANHFIKNNFNRIEVLIIKGASTGWESVRYKSFAGTLSEKLDTTYIYSDPIRYDRVTARDACRILLKEHSVNKRITINGIFAANDDMAIGAKTALQELLYHGYTVIKEFGIVGYDGINEMKELLASSDLYIIGSVDVKISEQAALCIKQLLKKQRDNSDEIQTPLIHPKKLTRQ